MVYITTKAGDGRREEPVKSMQETVPNAKNIQKIGITKDITMWNIKRVSGKRGGEKRRRELQMS